MSGPRPVSGVEYFGVPVSEWRRVAQLALRDVQANPNDAEARQQLTDAQRVLRHHANVTGVLQSRAITREGQNLADQTVAEMPSGAQAFAANALHGASLGAGDELAGLAAILPGGLSPQQARDQYRAGRGELYAAHPFLSAGGDITGSLLLAGAGARATGLGAPIAAGGTLTGSGLRAAGAAAALAGTEGALRGALSEGSASERAQSAAIQGGVGAVVGAAGTAATNVVRTRLAERAARRELLQLRLDRARGGGPIDDLPMGGGVPTRPTPPSPTAMIESGTPSIKLPASMTPSNADDAAALQRRIQQAVDASRGKTTTVVPEFAPTPSTPVGQVPSMVVSPSHSPANAARTAYTQVLEATGNPDAARAAARDVAGRARAAMTGPALDPVDRAMQMQTFLSQPPTVESVEGLMTLLKTMTPVEQQAALRAFPALWKTALGVQ